MLFSHCVIQMAWAHRAQPPFHEKGALAGKAVGEGGDGHGTKQKYCGYDDHVSQLFIFIHVGVGRWGRGGREVVGERGDRRTRRSRWCLILYALNEIKNSMAETSIFLQVVIFSMQILGGVGAGIVGTMYIVVRSDVSASTGRFSPTLGLMSDSRDDDDLEEMRQNKVERILLRNQWRGGGTECENEKALVARLYFPHIFDMLKVEMRIVNQADRSTEITRSGRVMPDPPAADVETFTWERIKSTTPDSDAFFVVHNKQSEFILVGGEVCKLPTTFDYITAPATHGSFNCGIGEDQDEDTASSLQRLATSAVALLINIAKIILVVVGAFRLPMVTGQGQRTIMIPFPTIIKYFTVFACLISRIDGLGYENVRGDPRDLHGVLIEETSGGSDRVSSGVPPDSWYSLELIPQMTTEVRSTIDIPLFFMHSVSLPQVKFLIHIRQF
jgi:hypothetical protein